MGRDLKDPRILDRANDVLGFDLKKLCLEGPEEELQKTENSQPAILLISYAKFLEKEQTPDYFAGHSLGEFTALVAAKSLDFETALALVRKRGELMADCDRRDEGAMVALIGETDHSLVEEICLEEQVDIAGINSPKQITISGSKQKIEKAGKRFSSCGLKIVYLKVRGAFHSRLMELARRRFKKTILKVDIKKPELPVVFNATGTFGQNPENIKYLLLSQTTSPVLFQKTIETMVLRGVENFVEVGPKEQLSPLIEQTVKALGG